ncbi:hypothetical protein S7711_09499 [Stachybotrys chartarum IBT 7711]|uniref:Inositol-pentakisphosphate 2-kinase n=1 Tax=Stachybotrys chartarum (strain CBS 109288 / IBT 7711) TaxID=1280523 RepID=A0A084AND6_STACB|nr:hypothetical protein S7711_09499 [Stachybotrys chartarum IBT 7711]
MANSQASKLQPVPGPADARRPSPAAGPQHHDGYPWITSRDMAIIKDVAKQRGFDDPALYLGQLKTLPKGTRPVRLIGEGSANAVFELKFPETCRHASEFNGLLLRVAKVTSTDSSLAYDYLVQQKFHLQSIVPILGEDAVRQELVVLHESDIVHHLNEYLRSINGSRKKKFQGTFVIKTNWGFFVEDMRPRNADDDFLVEFKPKWLLQSPSAPDNAIRCRQCAMELRNLLTDPVSYKGLPLDKPCPLVLGNPHAPEKVASPSRIAHQLAGDELLPDYQEALLEVAGHRAIAALKHQQARLDKQGPLHAPFGDPDFSLAMTLRDCTCFARIPRRQAHGGRRSPVRICFGDLDWKNPAAKATRWRHAEEELIAGGYYTADWILANQALYHPPTLCLLEWTERKSTKDVDIIALETKPGTTGTVPRSEGGRKLYTQTTDLDTLNPILENFVKEPAGTQPDDVRNPFRNCVDT